MTGQMTDAQAVDTIENVLNGEAAWKAWDHIVTRLRALSEPADNGPWKRNGLKFYSDDTHDAMIVVNGDFGGWSEEERYGAWLLGVLNGAPALSEQQGEAVAVLCIGPAGSEGTHTYSLDRTRDTNAFGELQEGKYLLYIRPQPAAGDAVRALPADGDWRPLPDTDEVSK